MALDERKLNENRIRAQKQPRTKVQVCLSIANRKDYQQQANFDDYNPTREKLLKQLLKRQSTSSRPNMQIYQFLKIKIFSIR